MSGTVLIDQTTDLNQNVSGHASIEPIIDNQQATTSEPATDNRQSTTKPVRICRHIKDDGLRCGTPALNGRNFCYHHYRAHHPGARIGTRRYRMPLLDSVASLQIALAHTLQALVTGELTPKQANSVMYGISLGSNLLRLAKPLTDAEQQQVVTEIPAEMEEVLVGPEDPEAAPENQIPEVPEQLVNAVRVTQDEVKRLRQNLLTPDEFRRCQETVRTFTRNDPEYYTAVNRICDHDSSYQRLRQLGVL